MIICNELKEKIGEGKIDQVADGLDIIKITEDAAMEIAIRGRGVPRILVTLLERSIDIKNLRDNNILMKEHVFVAVIMLGVYTQVDNSRSFSDLSDEELYAYNQTMEVFNLVSSKLNKG